MIVVDTNVVAYLLIPSAQTRECELLRSQDRVWHVPQLFEHEWLNVVASHVKSKEFDRDRGIRIFRCGRSIVEVAAVKLDPVRIVNMAAGTGCSAYDCQFVALAEALRVPLLTFDGAILKGFPSTAVSPANYARGQ